MRTVDGKPCRPLTAAEKQNWRLGKEAEYPGYLDENTKLYAIVKIFTGVRVLHSLFFLLMTVVYGMDLLQGAVNLLSPFFFYLWYSFMLRSGKFLAVMMLVLRGFGVVNGGIAALQMAPYLQFPLIFLLVSGIVIEFAEAVFCIYILTDRQAALAVKLNRELSRTAAYLVAPDALNEAASYVNDCGEDGEKEENGDANTP